tara:strand:+ start:2578 stop:2724 length:147 start_codon:yes stop_codon:yes gene_type:complete
MNETALLEFQIAETLDAVRIGLSSVGLVVGVVGWTWLTYFVKDEHENR